MRDARQAALARRDAKSPQSTSCQGCRIEGETESRHPTVWRCLRPWSAPPYCVGTDHLVRGLPVGSLDYTTALVLLPAECCAEGQPDAPHWGSSSQDLYSRRVWASIGLW